jgi:hypothetical protein
MQNSPVLALLRRLEARNIWQMSYNIKGNIMPQQTFSAVATEPEQPEGTPQ